MVGARNAGKTSWIGTLLGNVELSGGKRERAEAEQRIKQFGEGVVEIGPPSTKTADMRSITVEVMEGDQKTSLTLLDSVGWESPAGRSSEVYDLEMERQLGHVMDEVEKRFDETLNAVSEAATDDRPQRRAHLAPFPSLCRRINSFALLNEAKNRTSISLSTFSTPTPSSIVVRVLGAGARILCPRAGAHHTSQTIKHNVKVKSKRASSRRIALERRTVESAARSSA